MAYVYGKLREALLGSTGDKVSRDLSPNMIKALFIGRENIVVVYHNRSSRVVRMNFSEVSEELGSGLARRESLNNVLNKYKMGCIEELYADVAFRGIQGGYLDLERYVSGLARCRLRYYGWYTGDATEAIRVYEWARVNQKYLYTVAEDPNIRGRVLQMEVAGVKGKELPWYRVHDLRVNDYPVDGALEKYFARVDGLIESIIKEQEEKATASSRQALLKTLVGMENGWLKDYQVYVMMYKVCGGCGEVGSILKSKVFDCQAGSSCFKPVKGVEGLESIEKLSKVLLPSKIEDIDVSECSIEELSERVKSGIGLFEARKAYRARAGHLLGVCDGNKMMFMSLYSSLACRGTALKLSAVGLMEEMKAISESENWFSELNLVLLRMLGFSGYDTFIQYCKTKNGGTK